MEQFYRESPAQAYYNTLVADLVAGFASAFDETRPLRVLEVGAGTGGTTAIVLPRLNPGHSRYVFTDVSPLFTDRARAKFSAEYPFLSTRLFDVTRDIAGQGIEPGSYDLILAANVLHATPDVKPCVERLRELLAPNGALLLLEITCHPRWLDIIFGLMDGWWKFEDRRLRPHHPLMPGQKWKGILEECGFDNATVIADTAPGEPAESIIFGRRAAEQASAKRWLVFADEGGVGKRLAALLGECTLVFAADADWPASADFEGIIYLWSLDSPQHDDCGRILPVLQRIIKGSQLEERGLVLVTAGAQPAIRGEEPAIMQAPLWGLGRCILKEWPKLRCRLADLSAAPTDTEIAALAQEILTGDATTEVWEEEVAFRGANRFVHRLRPTTLARIADNAPPIEAGPEDKWHAQMSTNSFDSMVLRAEERLPPEPHQVEVAIRAAGLNFRDIVVGSGVIAPLECDNSSGSERLGVDFSGVVTRCGEAVQSVRPGDEVFGLALGTFASFAITDAALVAQIPANLAHEQASSIPVAFITVHYALRYLARLSKGESILIHVASGAVGLAAIQMAQACGARIFATMPAAPQSEAYLESLGVTDVMDSRSLAFADEIAERTGGRGVDVVLNSLSGEALERGIAALATHGRFVELGKTDIHKNSRLQLFPFRRNLSFLALDLERMRYERPGICRHTAAGGRLSEFSSGALKPIPFISISDAG